MTTPADKLREKAKGIREHPLYSVGADGRLMVMSEINEREAVLLDLLADAWAWIDDQTNGCDSTCGCDDCSSARALLARIEEIA